MGERALSAFGTKLSWSKLGQIGTNWGELGANCGRLGQIGANWVKLGANWDKLGKIGEQAGLSRATLESPFFLYNLNLIVELILALK